MNENKITSQRVHTRVKFTPLTCSCSLVCLTPQSPLTQSVNTTLSPVEYEPDRSLSPTILKPEVRAFDPDGIFNQGAANSLLSLDSIEWLVDGKAIQDVWVKGTDYEIVTDEGDERGCLRVKKNLPAGETATLRFKGKFLDYRDKKIYAVESDEVSLSATDKGADAVACFADKPFVEYDPLYDDLLLYEYKVAHGIEVQGNRDEHKDGKSYEQEVSVIVTMGSKEMADLPDGMTMRLLSGGEAVTPRSEAHPEVLSMAYPKIVFDMRLIDKASYEVQFVRDGKAQAQCQIGLHTSVSMPTMVQPTSGADIVPSQTNYTNSVLVQLADRVVEYPELYYLIQWHTQGVKKVNGEYVVDEPKQWQNGKDLDVPIRSLGLGTRFENSYFEAYFDVCAQASCSLCRDENGNVLVDETGDFLIF